MPNPSPYLKFAVAEIKGGMPMNIASAKYAISVRTLRKHVSPSNRLSPKGLAKIVEANRRRGGNPDAWKAHSEKCRRAHARTALAERGQALLKVNVDRVVANMTAHYSARDVVADLIRLGELAHA